MLKYYNQKLLIAGTDEAGRGCLSGPVTAAAVILPKNFYHPMLDDSKKLSAKQRAILAHYPIITTYYRCFIEYKKDFSFFSLQFPKNAVKVPKIAV